MMKPGRPIPPPKPKRATSQQDLRDSGISVTEEPSFKRSHVDGRASSQGGVRQLASRFESIRLMSSALSLSVDSGTGLSKNARYPLSVFATNNSKPRIKPVIPPKPAWKQHDMTTSRRTLAIEQRANEIAEQIYDTVCERNREHSEHEGSYEELDDPISADGYSSFESSSDEEETPDEPGRKRYSSLVSLIGDVTERPASLDSNASGDHITKVIDELLEKEQKYIETLDQGIRNYVPAMNSQTLPAALRGLRIIIFINLEEILQLHRDHLLPDLQRAASSPPVDSGQSDGRVVEKIAQTFLEYIENDRFYCYVQFAMHHAQSEALRMNHREYFLKVQHDLNDKLGLNSLLLQPIQRLPRYKLLMNEMVKDLMKHVDGKRTLNRRTALLCKVDKRLSNLVDRVNQAINISDIRQCSGSAPTRSVTHTLEIPLTLILQPKGNRNPDRDTPINLLYQGRFVRLFLLEIYDSNLRRKYAGKLFAFEKLLIYVEILRDRMEYRGHYFDSEVCFTEEGINRIVLFAGGQGIQEIIVQSDTNTEIQPLLALLQDMTRAMIYDSVEAVKDSKAKEWSDQQTLHYKEDEEATNAEDPENTSPVWDEQRLTSSLIDAQGQFLKVLEANRVFYLASLSTELKQKLDGFITAFESIVNLHNKILQDISESPPCPDSICRCFERYLMTDIFAPHFHHLREFRKAVKYIQHCQTPSNFHNRVASTVEQFTFLCIEHLQEFNRYFETLIVKYSDDSTLNLPINKELFQRLAFVQVRLNAYRVDLVLNYNLFLLDERLPSCGLVFYNDRAMLSRPFRDADAGPCRVFVCERAAVCVKVQDIPEHGQPVERFVRVLFVDRFAGRGMLMKARRSKRRPERINFLMDGIKFRIDFSDMQSQNKFFQSYVDKYTKM